MGRDDDEGTELLGVKNPLNNDASNNPRDKDPATMPRGEDANVSLLMIEATSEDALDSYWYYFSVTLKILFTVGLAPSLWHTEKEEINKSVRARKRMTDLFSMSNVAIACHYWNVGLAMGFLSTPMVYYLVDTKDAESALVNQYYALVYLPWCLKVFVGLYSDSIPLFGQHRKPYFVLGWALFVLSCAWLGCYAEPSIAAVNYLSFVQTMGYLISDVVADALIVERSVYESHDDLGIMRTEGYLIRSVGGIVGSVLGAILYNKSSWGWGMTIGQLCWLQACIPIVTMAPMVPWLFDGGLGYIPLKVQVNELWELVQRRTVWWPMSFVYLYSLMQISNPVWANYLVEGLGFGNFDLGLITIVSAVFSWVALYVYRTYFFGVNWQLIYYCTTFLNFILSAMQLLLVFDLTGGIPKLVFACGDYAFIAFSNYMQFMPMCIVALAVIPGGIEGASYAMLTTWMNVAGEVGYDIGTSFSNIWDVSNCVLSEGKIYGLWRLTLLTSCLQLSPVFLIWMFPKDKDAVMDSLKHEFKSKTAGAMFLAVLIVSILGTLIYSILIIYDSGLGDDDGGCDDDDGDDDDDDSSSYLYKRY